MAVSQHAAAVERPACFRFASPVYFDELDLLGVLHNSRFPVHVERAQSALFEHLGFAWTELSQRHPDLNYLVRSVTLDLTAPVTAPGIMHVDVVAAGLGRTSATWQYHCTVPQEAGEIAAAAATRVVVKVGPDGRPAPWSDEFRALFEWLAAGAQGSPP